MFDANKKEIISKAKWIILTKLGKYIFVFKSSIFMKLSKTSKFLNITVDNFESKPVETIELLVQVSV